MPTILKPGSKGPLVSSLQKFLNQKSTLSRKIPESGDYDGDTIEAVRAFQKKAGVKVDGTVGSDTAAALAKLVGAGAADFAKAFGITADDAETEVAQDKEEHVIITLDGKKGTMTKAEFEDFQKKMRESLRGFLRTAEQQAATARGLWDHFNELNSEQYIVGWCVQLIGPSLPDVGLIVDAESAVKMFSVRASAFS